MCNQIDNWCSPILQTQNFGYYSLKFPLWISREITTSPRAPVWVKWFAGKILGVHHRFSQGCYDIEYMGIRLRLLIKENLSDFVIFRLGAHHEADEFGFFDRIYSKQMVFVDIGANIGLYSLLANKTLSRNSRIISFEPNPRTASKLRVNVLANGADNIEILEMGVSDTTGYVTLFRGDASSAGCASMRLHPNTSGNSVNSESIVVESAILPDILDQIGVESVDVVKIDIEGYEDAALLPLFDKWSSERWPDYILIEIEHKSLWTRDCIRELHEIGYREIFRNSNNLHLHLGE